MIDAVLAAAAEAKAHHEAMMKMVRESEAERTAKYKLAYEGWVKLNFDEAYSQPKVSFEEFRAMVELDLL